jgi:hypothetical protein
MGEILPDMNFSVKRLLSPAPLTPFAGIDTIINKAASDLERHAPATGVLGLLFEARPGTD